MTERFTLLRDLKWCGGIFSLIGIALLTATALDVNWGHESDSAEEQWRTSLLMSGTAVLSLAFGIWQFALAIRTAVITGQRSLFVRSLFTQRTIPWDEISRARWSGGGLTLYWPGGRRKVSGANFSDDRGKQLLRILRARIDRDVQEGWNEHYERILTPRVMTRAEHDAMIRSMYRCVLLWGLPGGVVIALGLIAVAQLPAAAYRELAIKGVLYGLVTTAAFLVLSALLDWFGRPKDPPASD